MNRRFTWRTPLFDTFFVFKFTGKNDGYIRDVVHFMGGGEELLIDTRRETIVGKESDRACTCFVDEECRLLITNVNNQNKKTPRRRIGILKKTNNNNTRFVGYGRSANPRDVYGAPKRKTVPARKPINFGRSMTTWHRFSLVSRRIRF